MVLVVLAAVALRPLSAFGQFIVEEYKKVAVAVGFARTGEEGAEARPLPAVAMVAPTGGTFFLKRWFPGIFRKRQASRTPEAHQPTNSLYESHHTP